MGQRVIVGVEPDADIKTIKAALDAASAESVQGPSPELPNVLIVTIPNDQDINKFISLAQKLPGVRYAESDSWQFTA
jgi:hypothetical protein